METLAAAFTDHLAVCLRLSVLEPIMRRGPGYWKMDARILEDRTVVEQFKILMSRLRRQENVFPNTPIWWDRSCKRRIQVSFRKIQAERMRDHRAMDNNYYECIYERLKQPAHNADTRTVLQKLKAKIVHLHNIRLNQLLNDNNTAERTEGEQPTMYNVLQMRKRRNERNITALRDKEGITQMTTRGIARTLVTYMGEKYKRIEVSTEYVQHLLREIQPDQLNQYNEAMRPDSPSGR
jgi:glutamate synthase domain-containing protein 2